MPRTFPWSTGLAFGLPLALYIATAAPTVYNLDSAELTVAAATLGLMRSPGYPLYVLLGHLWSHLPVGDVGYRMNLFSAFCGAVALALVERLLARLGVDAGARLAAVGLLAVSRYFWALSLIAEVYTLECALVAALLLALLRWQEVPSPGRLATATLLIGLAFSHRTSAVLLAPGCLWLVLRTDARKALSVPSLAAAAGGLALGLAPYLYLPLACLRQPVFNYAGWYDAAARFHAIDLTTWNGLWWLVSGKVFVREMLAYSSGELPTQLSRFGNDLWRTFAAIGVVPGLAGLAVLWRRRPAWAEATALMFVVVAGFHLTYRVIDQETMFLTSYLLWTVWLGVGYGWLVDLAGGGERRRLAPTIVYAVGAGAVAFSLVYNLRLNDLSHDRSARERGEAILAQAAPRALVVGWWETVPVLQYLQIVEGRRPDLHLINRFLVRPEALQPLLETQSTGRPVYVDDAQGIDATRLVLEPGKPLLRVRRR